MEHIFISGISSGIGYATMAEFLKQGYIVHGTVRKPEDQTRLLSEFPSLKIYIMDITNSDHIEAMIPKLNKNLNDQRLSALINNSGIAVAGPLEHLPIAEFRQQFEVNVIGTLNLTQHLIPLLNHDQSTIINISSKSGLFALPFTGAYSASKFALEAMTDAMRREMSQTGIRFVLVEPAAVKTPIWDKAETIDLEPYRNTRYSSVLERVKEEVVKGGKRGAPVDKLASLIVTIHQSKNPQTRYRFANNVFKEITLPNWLSDKKLDKLVKKRLYGN